MRDSTLGSGYSGDENNCDSVQRDQANPSGKRKSLISSSELPSETNMGRHLADGHLQSLATAMVYNPCYDHISIQDDEDSDELALSEFKMRKRTGRMHGEASTHANYSNLTNGDD